MNELGEAIAAAAKDLGYDAVKPRQAEVISNFVGGNDVFVSLPTGSGKSLCYYILPAVFNKIRSKPTSVAVIVSPLVALMQEQVSKLNALRTAAVYVGDLPDDHSSIHNCEYRLVFISPESLLVNMEWREMIQSEIYQENMIAFVVDEAHCVKQWGDSFRTEFSKIGEVRSLLPSVNIMALTATATKSSRKKIIKTLGMIHPVIISDSPDRRNIHLSVQRKQMPIETHFRPLLEEIKNKRNSFPRTIIFCHSYDDCSCIYLFLRKMLGSQGTDPVGAPDLVRFRIVDMFSACTDPKIKQNIQESFSDPARPLRVIIATIAFGMGLNYPNIRRIYHWGPPSDIESYLQEIGRAGRDGNPANAVLYYSSTDFTFHTDKLMKEYCKNHETCQRELLLREFDNFNLDEFALDPFFCCDVCDQNQ